MQQRKTSEEDWKMIDTIKNFLNEHESDMIDLLERVVNINSYSANPEGVNRVANVLEEELQGMGFATRRIQNDTVGDHLVAENPARQAGGGGVMMVGHMDTVFPPEMGFNEFRQEGNMIYGPGTSDMKAGLVIGIFVAKALAAAGYQDIPVGFFFNSDEEIGSPHSREPIVEAAKKSDFCFVMEGSGMGGEVTTGRKGRTVFNLHVNGEASHAGHCPVPKPSAILELAHKVTALEALNDPEAGTSLNVGLIEGGVGPNTVPAQASARVETRYVSLENRKKVWDAIERIAATSSVEGTSASIEILTNRPPMVTNDAIMSLYDTVNAAAGEIDMKTQSVFRGGGSDANTIAEAGIPVLDGMGPAGSKFHTSDEYMLADSLVKQALLTAVGIVKAGTL